MEKKGYEIIFPKLTTETRGKANRLSVCLYLCSEILEYLAKELKGSKKNYVKASTCSEFLLVTLETRKHAGHSSACSKKWESSNFLLHLYPRKSVNNIAFLRKFERKYCIFIYVFIFPIQRNGNCMIITTVHRAVDFWHCDKVILKCFLTR